MTISKAIIQWMYQNDTIEIDEKINTNLLDAKATAYALSKTPSNTVEQFNDGSEKRTEYYTLLTKRSSQLDIERVSNDQFLENLEEWVWEQNLNGNVPKLDNKRYCDNIAISSSYYLFENETEESIYSLTLEIQYRKEI